MEAYVIFFLSVCAVCLLVYCIQYYIQAIRRGRSSKQEPIPPTDTGNYNLYKHRTANNALYYRQYKKFRKTTKTD